MNHERGEIFPGLDGVEEENRQDRIRSWLWRRGVEDILLDFDDTLIDTVTVFRMQIEKYLDLVAPSVSGVSREFLGKRLREVNNELFFVHAVNPNRWEKVALRLERELGGGAWEANLDVLQEVYRIPPIPYPEAEAVLETLFPCARLTLVTHANEAWTDFKLDSLGWRHFFEGRVGIVSQDGYKTGRAWEKAISPFGILPGNSLAAGDNIKGDLIATREIGVGYQFWLDRKKNWTLYREGELPLGTVRVDDLNGMITYMDR